MNLIQILLNILLLKVVACLAIDPICQQCLQIDTSLVTSEYRPILKTNLTLFRLPGFSKATIIVDYRHLKEFPLSNGKQIFSLFFQVIDLSTGQKYINIINDTIIGTNQYQLANTQELNLVIFIFVEEDFKPFQYLLRNSVSLKLSYSNNRIPQEDSSFLFVVKSQDNINLPLNKPDLNNIRNYYLENQRNDTNLVDSTLYTQSTMYWGTESQFVVPYFPYFSNCQGEGNMMQIMQLLQSQSDCSLISINQTGWISEFSFASSAKADRCSIKRKCIIEGDLQKTEYPDWQTLPRTLNIFSITQQKIPWQNYKYNMDFESQNLVACKINTSLGSNSSSSYPLRVKLTMGYYQVSQTQKKIINCQVEYDLYVTSTANFTYQLEISSYPLNHTYIMLNFGFKWYVYMIVFLIIGLVGNVQNLLIWVYHYFAADQRKDINIMIYFRIIKEIIKGTMMALTLQFVVIFIVSVIMNGKIFTTTFYQESLNGSTSPRVLFDYILEDSTNNYDSTQVKNIRSGRMGVSFIVIGVMIILDTCHFFIGKQKKKSEYKDFQILGRMFKPLQWNRGKFLFGTFLFISIQYFFIYFAYSTIYSENIWTFIVLMKVLQVIMEQITNSVYDDILPGLPLKIITDITAYVITISAADLYDFLFGSLLDVAITMIQKIYIFQIQNIAVEKIQQKSEEFNKFYLNLMNEQDGDQEVLQNYGFSQNMMQQDQDQKDNQHVFIYRETQQVQFFEEEIKESYAFTKIQDEQNVIYMTKETEEQKKIKKKYFESLQRDYRKQRQLLFKDKKSGLGAEQQKTGDKKDGMDNAQNQKQQDMQRQSAIFQLLLDHIAMIYTFLVNPFVVFIFWLTYDESAILLLFGIVYNTVVLYILSALVIGVFSVINIIMIFHILESYMGFSFQIHINDILSRFNLRKKYWKADEDYLNDKVKPEIRGADHYCLSSQLFFILTVYVGGMIFVILGLAIIFKTNYNLFDDVATIPNALFWMIFLYLFKWLMLKTAALLNVWDYSQHKKNQQDQNKAQTKMNGIVDYNNFEDNSEFKTQNIMLVDEFSNDNLLLSQSKKTLDKSNSIPSKGTKKQIQIRGKMKKNRLLLHSQNLRIQNWQAKDQILLAHRRLQTICTKLQPLFSKQSFKLEYSQKNKQFIKENIEKILPLVDYLPQLQQFKNMQLSLATGSHDSSKTQSKQESINSSKKHQSSNANRNMDPSIAQIILIWLRVTQKSKMNRIVNGLDEQSKLKKCSFCYSTWGLYYGHNSTCLQCSMLIAAKNEQKQSTNRNETNFYNKKSPNSSISGGRNAQNKRKSTRKKNNLNVIKEEDDFQDQFDQQSDEDQYEDVYSRQQLSKQLKLHRD